MMTFEQILNRLKPGDASKIAEKSGRSIQAVSAIIRGYRKPQHWFLEDAEAYLRFMGRLDKEDDDQNSVENNDDSKL